MCVVSRTKKTKKQQFIHAESALGLVPHMQCTQNLLCLQITSTMSKFEGLFEDLDVHTQVMDSAMSTATTLSTPEGQVDNLMKQVTKTLLLVVDPFDLFCPLQVAEENGLEVLDKLDETPVSQRNPGETSGAGLQTLTNEEEDTLSSRFIIHPQQINQTLSLSLSLDWQLCGNQTDNHNANPSPSQHQTNKINDYLNNIFYKRSVKVMEGCGQDLRKRKWNEMVIKQTCISQQT